MKYNRWTVLGKDPDRPRRWLCQCDCGSPPKSVFSSNVSSGKSTSCGCYGIERRKVTKTTHGHSGKRTPEYQAWSQMKNRCLNPNYRYFKNYGGRNIAVHPAWVDDFQAFYDHVGPRPSPQHSLDREENDGNYEPGNVRWATKSEQAQNRRPRKRRKYDLPEGVHCNPRMKTRPYTASAYVHGVRRHLGYFPTPEEAHQAYLVARSERDPAHASHPANP